MKVLILFLLLILPLIIKAEPDPKDVQTLCNPSNYTTSEAYWKVLLEYGLVNQDDQQAHQVVWQDSEFANRVSLNLQLVNLFGDEQQELVLKLNFNNQSYYIHFFYAATADTWHKTQHLIDYHIPIKRQAAERWVNVEFKEVFREGEYVLLVEKKDNYDGSDESKSWLSIWKVQPMSLQMLHTRKMYVKSDLESLRTQMEFGGVSFPKSIQFAAHHERMDEEGELELEEENVSQWIVVDEIEECSFRIVNEYRCDCAIQQKETRKIKK